MAQLYVQRNAQPDTWVMSGAPTATTVFLSLDAQINYSDGASDSLPANTLAVLPDATHVFDRTSDVYIPYTVKGSGVLSIIKESDLPTLTSAYAPLARVELHGIKPYQPEPYLASGTGPGGAGVAQTTNVPSLAGQGTIYPLGSAPSGWQNTGFDDSAWASAVAQSSGGGFEPPMAGTAEISAATGNQANGFTWLHRRPFVLPVGAPSSATLQIRADNYVDGVWVNGTSIGTPGVDWATTIGPPATMSVPTSLLMPGGSNLLAMQIRNGTGSGLGGTSPTTVDYLLTVDGTLASATDPTSAEGDLIYRHNGALFALPIGTSGQELTVVSGDPAWATPPSGGSVTSVALAGPTGTSVSGSPVTSSGTLTLSWASQSANTFLGAPNGSSGAPTFRVLVAADVPSLPASQITSGQLAPARGGTGTDGSAAANGALLIGNGSGYSLATLSAGSGVTITNGSGTITIASSGGGGSGTVTSVALTVPGFLSVGGSPITTSGTLAVSLTSESAATVFAGPASGSAAAPTFRALAGSDLPAAPAAGGHIHAHVHLR